MSERTPEQEKRLKEIAEKFRRDMEKLGLGVAIKTEKSEFKITDPPEKKP